VKGRNIPVLLQEIVDNINRIRELTKEITYNEFLENDLAYIGTTECIKKISEASEQMPTIVRVKHTLIPWTGLAGLYAGISQTDLGTDPVQVWKAGTEYLPGIKPRVKQMLEEYQQ
jgi:uncharacterized protein with HEPN domain